MTCGECALYKHLTNFMIGGDKIVAGGHRYQNLDQQILQELLTHRRRQARVFARQFSWQSCGVLRCTEREGANSQFGIVGDTEPVSNHRGAGFALGIRRTFGCQLTVARVHRGTCDVGGC